MDAMKAIYAYITTTQHSQNLTFKNVLLFVVMSTSVDTNQMHIVKTIGAFRYSIWKAIDRQVQAN